MKNQILKTLNINENFTMSADHFSSLAQIIALLFLVSIEKKNHSKNFYSKTRLIGIFSPWHSPILLYNNRRYIYNKPSSKICKI